MTQNDLTNRDGSKGHADHACCGSQENGEVAAHVPGKETNHTTDNRRSQSCCRGCEHARSDVAIIPPTGQRQVGSPEPHRHTDCCGSQQSKPRRT